LRNAPFFGFLIFGGFDAPMPPNDTAGFLSKPESENIRALVGVGGHISLSNLSGRLISVIEALRFFY